jgi:hypothetical protein
LVQPPLSGPQHLSVMTTRRRDDTLEAGLGLVWKFLDDSLEISWVSARLGRGKPFIACAAKHLLVSKR